MMLCKLSLKNIKKSIKDYAIYFFTLILGVAIFYVFNALGSQTVMMDVSSSTEELIELMMTMLSGVSVFVSFILGFLIIYASRFLMKRRNKEFGVYLTLGMSKRKISLILFFETLFIGIISLVVGLGIGIILSQLMSLVVANMFEADLTKFAFVFSSSSCIKTIIYFGIMYLFVMIFNTYSVSKCKLIDLLNGAKTSEKIKLKNPILCIIIFIISCLVLGKAYHLVTVEFLTLQEAENILVPIVMGCVSTFFIFWSLSGLLLRIARSMKNFYYKGLNSFTLRQFSSKINTTVFSTTIICLMLFITICLLSACLTMKNSMNANIKELAPADFMFTTNMNMDKYYDSFRTYGYNDNKIKNSHYTVLEMFNIFNYDITRDVKEYVEINTYATPDLTMNHTLGSKLDSVRTSFPFLQYDTKESIIKISDYNKVARLYGNEEYSLKDDEYMIVADFKSMVEIRNMALENGETINLFGHTLKPKYNSCQDGFLEMSSNHINTGIILVSDNVINEDYLVQNHLIGNYNTSDKNEIEEIENNINALAKNPKANDYLLPSGSTRLSIKEATTGLSAMVTFIGLYLGVIFLISSAAVLGLKELSESSDNKQRFRMLRKIGTDEKMINKALFRQIAIFFILPLILALIHSVFGIMFAMKILEVFGNDQLLPSIIMTTIFMVIIYGGYFLITYYCSKNIIKERY
ncbi:ABC transporter permease [Thomasclavelia cocleata]|jgi:putative ABC transport system permease protein|uniref:ABC transporter permease n=1 Tax=Thomasclavelia cocleata TaxID=69824 RepID=UPI00272E2862|nr:ABC transporter permease [Thomasclavelia cocleata]